MSNYKILDAKYGITDGGMACGPISGYVVVTVKFECEGKIQYLSIDDYESFPTFYLTDDDIFDNLKNEAEDDFLDYLESKELYEIDDIDLSTHEYFDIYDSLYQKGSGPAYSLIKFAIAIVRLCVKDTKKLIKESIGRYVTEIDIPETEDEKDYKDSIEK